MKFDFCENVRNEITPTGSFISGFIMQTVIRNWLDTEIKIFHFARNEISCKHPLSSKGNLLENTCTVLIQTLLFGYILLNLSKNSKILNDFILSAKRFHEPLFYSMKFVSSENSQAHNPMNQVICFQVTVILFWANIKAIKMF